MVSTKLVGKFFAPRRKKIELYNTQAEALQEQVFRKLIKNAAHT